jgi:predicted transcriptional regulator
MKNTRSRIEIIADILGHTCSPCKPTAIMYRANLSYEQLKAYLAFLMEKKWITRQAGDWITTEGGREYLNAYSKLKEILDREPTSEVAMTPEINWH